MNQLVSLFCIFLIHNALSIALLFLFTLHTRYDQCFLQPPEKKSNRTKFKKQKFSSSL